MYISWSINLLNWKNFWIWDFLHCLYRTRRCCLAALSSGVYQGEWGRRLTTFSWSGACLSMRSFKPQSYASTSSLRGLSVLVSILKFLASFVKFETSIFLNARKVAFLQPLMFRLMLMIYWTARWSLEDVPLLSNIPKFITDGVALKKLQVLLVITRSRIWPLWWVGKCFTKTFWWSCKYFEIGAKSCEITLWIYILYVQNSSQPF